MKKCKAASKYKAKKKPTCGCLYCMEKWADTLEKKLKAQDKARKFDQDLAQHMRDTDNLYRDWYPDEMEY